MTDPAVALEDSFATHRCGVHMSTGMNDFIAGPNDPHMNNAAVFRHKKS